MQARHLREAVEASLGNRKGRRHLSLLWGLMKPERLSVNSRAGPNGWCVRVARSTHLAVKSSACLGFPVWMRGLRTGSVPPRV